MESGNANLAGALQIRRRQARAAMGRTHLNTEGWLYLTLALILLSLLLMRGSIESWYFECMNFEIYEVRGFREHLLMWDGPPEFWVHIFMSGISILLLTRFTQIATGVQKRYWRSFIASPAILAIFRGMEVETKPDIWLETHDPTVLAAEPGWQETAAVRQQQYQRAMQLDSIAGHERHPQLMRRSILPGLIWLICLLLLGCMYLVYQRLLFWDRIPWYSYLALIVYACALTLYWRQRITEYWVDCVEDQLGYFIDGKLIAMLRIR